MPKKNSFQDRHQVWQGSLTRPTGQALSGQLLAQPPHETPNPWRRAMCLFLPPVHASTLNAAQAHLLQLFKLTQSLSCPFLLAQNTCFLTPALSSSAASAVLC